MALTRLSIKVKSFSTQCLMPTSYRMQKSRYAPFYAPLYYFMMSGVIFYLLLYFVLAEVTSVLVQEQILPCFSKTETGNWKAIWKSFSIQQCAVWKDPHVLNLCPSSNVIYRVVVQVICEVPAITSSPFDQSWLCSFSAVLVLCFHSITRIQGWGEALVVLWPGDLVSFRTPIQPV